MTIPYPLEDTSPPSLVHYGNARPACATPDVLASQLTRDTTLVTCPICVGWIPLVTAGRITRRTP